MRTLDKDEALRWLSNAIFVLEGSGVGKREQAEELRKIKAKVEADPDDKTYELGGDGEWME